MNVPTRQPSAIGGACVRERSVHKETADITETEPAEYKPAADKDAYSPITSPLQCE